MNYKKRNRKPAIDYTLLFIVIFLLVFGLIMIYSASSYEAGMKFRGDSSYYLRNQLRATLIGVVVMIVVSRVDYHILPYFAVWGYLLSIVLILMVKTSLGITKNGATRWLNLGGLSLQPAEVAKVAMIIFFAVLIARGGPQSLGVRGNMVCLFLAALPAVLVWQVTDNMSSAIIIFGIVFFMLFISLPSVSGYILLILLACGGAAGIIYAVASGLLPETLSFRLRRIKAWLKPEAYAMGTGYQTLQALYSIGSGGLFGKGLGQSTQKLGFVPEAQNDMIFSIICEELGLFGAVAIIIMFIILLWRFFIIAENSQDLLGGLLVTGVMAHIALQVVLNVAVVTNTIPNTGITLPFISYGGSSVVFLLIEIGIVLNVSRTVG